MPEPTKAQLAARVKALETALERETAARQRAERQLAERDRVRAEALEQQRATSEILRVISSSPTDVQPVFDTIADSVMLLCDAWSAAVYPFDGELVHVTATRGGLPDSANYLRRRHPMRPTPDGPTPVRAIVERTIVHVPDSELDDRPGSREAGRARGFRAAIGVPMLRGGEPIGAIGVSRVEPGAFSAAQIEMLKTFADQAVIAIENVRLFTELQASNRELKTALDKQTATSDILRVISGSRTDVQPVFEAIVTSAIRLLGGYTSVLVRIAGDQLALAALTSTDPAGDAALRARYPLPLHSAEAVAHVIRDRASLNIADAQADPRLTEAHKASVRVRGAQCLVAVPLLRHDEALGAIAVSRREPGGFADDEIALLRTFADQAVIAIENARLLSELQDRNEALTEAHAQVSEALEQQRATSEILKVIASSPTDAQPVFDTIVRSSDRLLGGLAGSLALRVGDEVQLVALTPTNPEGDAVLRRLYPMPIGEDGGHAEVVRRCRPLMVTDTEAQLTGKTREFARIRGFRSRLSVPLIRDGIAIGSLGVTRPTPGAFTDREIALLQTFADQAVIAIENVRLFTELQQRTQDLTRSVGQLTALSEVSRALSSTLDLQAVLTTIVSRAVQLADGSGGVVYEHEPATQRWELRATHNIDAEVMDLQQSEPIRLGEGAVGRAVAGRRPVQIGDLRETSHYAARVRVRELLIARGYLSVLAVPLLVEDDILGALVILRREAGELAPQTVELMKTFATQSALAIQNARLFRELEIKSRELEVASRHKSEFLASMSHELRTPLNAIIGFSDVLLQGMFGETNEKQTEYLRDILASGQHLLSLINDILDLSKIEAGRMDLDLADFHLPSAVDDALLLMRERAARRGITLERLVDERLGEIRADQRKVKQVLLNLLSNAVKFTPEGGRIDVRAALADGSVEISVTDTGIGIAPEDHEAVFEEFKQVGKAEKKAEGTGLGLALCRKFVELHGGRIWVKSQLGSGSTFTFSLLTPR